MVKPRNQRKPRWFCKLCGSYDIFKRTAHLLKDHNITEKLVESKPANLFEYIFSEVIS